jgi:pimeloyl-ACP methyl ester carboxylesterase
MSTSTVSVGDAELDVHEQGRGPALLFLHGMDGLHWSGPIMDALSERFRVIAPHHPAWGASTRPHHVMDVRDIAMVYEEFVERIDGPFVMAGCSFGAWVAAELAIRRPANLAGLVLAAPVGIKLGDREDRDFADVFITHFDDLPGVLYGDASRAPDLSERPDEDYLYLAVAQEAMARYCWAPYMHDPKLRHWLRRIDVPSLVVGGSADRLVLLPGYFESYASLIGAGGAELRMVEGAGHRIEEEEPQVLADLVNEFVEAQVAAGAPDVAPACGR